MEDSALLVLSKAASLLEKSKIHSPMCSPQSGNMHIMSLAQSPHPDDVTYLGRSKCVETQTPPGGYVPSTTYYDPRQAFHPSSLWPIYLPPLIPLPATPLSDSDLDMPLNLSTTHPAPSVTSSFTANHVKTSPTPSSLRLTSSPATGPGDIDEHFRRSLAKYEASPIIIAPVNCSPRPRSAGDTRCRQSPTGNPTHLGKRASPEPTPCNAKSAQLSESIDDHFAKSLGNNVWKKLKHADTDDVDDHFARSLGGSVWKDIRTQGFD